MEDLGIKLKEYILKRYKKIKMESFLLLLTSKNKYLTIPQALLKFVSWLSSQSINRLYLGIMDH